MKEIVLVDGARSPFGKLGGGLKHLPATEIGAYVLKEFVKRTKILEKGKLDGVFAGCALGDCQTISPARYMLLAAGLPVEMPATFVEMQCGSAITALNHAAWKIAAGAADVLMVGGIESYSTYAAKFSTSQQPYKMIPPTAIPYKSAPTPEQDTDMISNSDRMAKKWGIAREACDEFACMSQSRIAKAMANGFIGDEVIPCTIPATRKTPEIVIDKDEQPRPDTTIEKLSRLSPVYEGGVTTAGNASGRNDGAAFILIMTAEKAKEYGYKPYARWITGTDVGCTPNLMGIGASYANLKILRRENLHLSDIDVYECNEAFAAQNLAVIKDMQDSMGEKISMDKWNPNGGAIAIGHPNAASGARITYFAMKQLARTGGRYGLISSCCGGGQGSAALIENIWGD
jgi:acetyl-CoA C-acetyltransferase